MLPNLAEHAELDPEAPDDCALIRSGHLFGNGVLGSGTKHPESRDEERVARENPADFARMTLFSQE
jgi:hypothetical protein